MSQRRRRSGLYSGSRGGKAQWGPAGSPASGPAVAGRRRQVPGRPRRVWPWVVLVVAALLAVPVGYFGFNIASTLCTISSNCGAGGVGALPNNGGTSVSGTVFVLLMGSDERHDTQGKIVSGEVPHSDTMILAAIDTDNKRVRVLSVPRDLVATIPGYGPLHRINEAYTIGETKHLPGGGPVLAVKTMEQLTGINIPYYAVTTFQGFRQTVDAVGGVSIDVDRPITDHDYPGEGEDFMPVYVAAGPQVLSGEKALEYVRSRHDDPIGDFGRNQRQQKFLGALTHKMLQPSRISQFQQFMDIAKTNIRTNLSPAQILSLAQSMVSVGRGRLQTYAVGPTFVTQPTSGPYAILGAVLVPDKAAISQLVSAFIRGDPPPTPSGTPAAPP